MPTFEVEVTDEVTITQEIEFEVFCANCGAGLCPVSEGGNTPRRNQPFVQVAPCEKCLTERFDEGFAEGKSSCE